MNAIPEVKCRWCRAPANDPSVWMRFRDKALILCPDCSLNVKQVLKMGNVVAREIGRKLRESR